MKANIIYIAAFSALLFHGCDFLDRYPYDEVTSKTVYSQATLAEAAVLGVYSNIKSDYNSAALSSLNWDAFSTVMDAYEAAYYSNYKYLSGVIQPDDASFLNYWKRFYEGIYRANDVIANIDQVPDMAEETKAVRKAECLALRAYFYYRLNALWGGVPVYLENLAPEEYTKGRSSEADVWQRVIADCTDALSVEALPGKYNQSDSDYGRVTKGMVYMLRAKAYMWLKEWDLAEKDLLEIGKLGYGLFKGSYADLFKEANEGCEEMVFSVQMRAEASQGNVFTRTYGFFHVAGGGGNNTFFANTNFVDSYQNADGSDFSYDDIIPGYSSMSPRARSVYFLRDGLTAAEQEKMERYGADMTKYLSTGNEARIMQAFEDRDPRLAASVITPYSSHSGGFTGTAIDYTLRWPFRDSNNSPYDLETKSNDKFLYNIRKFVTVGVEYTNSTYNPVDCPVYRYADVLLCLAECANEQDDINAAIGYVNEVRSRAGVAVIPAGSVASKEEMRSRIIKEKRWELAFEEQLYFEELRWGVWKEDKFTGNGLFEIWGEPVYSYGWGGDKYLHWPIPSKEKEMNTNLVQNEGWN